MEKNTNCRKITSNGREYALVISGNKLPKGLHFYTDDSKFVQAASWKYDKGYATKPHSHKICSRSSNITQEFIYVKKGSIKASIYNDKEKVIAAETLREGDSILIFEGGHKFTILEDGTEIFEVKNGPYPGMEKDKKSIEDG